MTEDQFKQRSFKHSMPVRYKIERMKDKYWDCLLLAVDFDNEVMKLWPLDDVEFTLGNGNEFWTSYKNVEFQPKNYLKLLKSSI